MSVFGFIENFFFVSLALVFILVLFLVYHFKSRITVAEKKSESMYGLLTAVVKEIKLLRSMFGLGSTDNVPLPATPDSISMEVKSKTEPEVKVPISTSSSGNNTFESFVKMDVPSKEVITFEIMDSENRIVVSDMEDSDSDEESVESAPHSEDEDEDEYEDDNSISTKSVNDLDNIGFLHSPTEQCTLRSFVSPENHRENAVEVFLENIDEENQAVNIDEENQVVNIDEIMVMDISALENEQNELKNPIAVNESSVILVENEQDLENGPADTDANKNKPTNDQLRKMNINQLKTIASQIGITEDISKMKKPELISLIQQK